MSRAFFLLFLTIAISACAADVTQRTSAPVQRVGGAGSRNPVEHVESESRPALKASVTSGSVKLMYVRRSFLDETGNRVDASVVVIPAKFVSRISVIDVKELIDAHEHGFPSYSMSHVVQYLKPLALANGGFTLRGTIPAPTGLLLINGRQVSPLETEWRVQDGILCINRSAVSILPRDAYRVGRCASAIQAGPIAIRAANDVVIYSNERDRTPYRRSLIALDGQRDVLLIATGAAHLFDVAEWLARPISAGGLGCVAAINLSGDTASGLYVKLGTKQLTTGELTTSLADAIAIK